MAESWFMLKKIFFRVNDYVLDIRTCRKLVSKLEMFHFIYIIHNTILLYYTI